MLNCFRIEGHGGSVNIPASFKRVQKKVFQDKRFYHYKPKEEKGQLGSVTMVADKSTRKSCKANVQYLNDTTIAKEYGLTVGSDIIITAIDLYSIEKGDFVEYDNKMFEVVETPKYDSHNAFLAKNGRWFKSNENDRI